MRSTMKPVFKHVTYACGHVRLETNPLYRKQTHKVCPVCEEVARSRGISVAHVVPRKG